MQVRFIFFITSVFSPDIKVTSFCLPLKGDILTIELLWLDRAKVTIAIGTGSYVRQPYYYSHNILNISLAFSTSSVYRSQFGVNKRVFLLLELFVNFGYFWTLSTIICAQCTTGIRIIWKYSISNLWKLRGYMWQILLHCIQ